MFVPNKTTEKMLKAFNETLAIIFAHEYGIFKALSKNEELTEIRLSEVTGIPKRTIFALVSLFAGQNPPLIQKTKEGKIRFSAEGKIYLDPQGSFFMGGLIDFISKNKDAFSPEAFAKYMMEDTPHRPMFKKNNLFNKQVIASMHAKSVGPASIWAEKMDLSGYSHLLDIGGGSGIFSVNALKRWQNLKATVFELPHIIETTNRYIKNTPVSTVAGDFWNDSFPEADIHLFSDIFHDWDEDKCSLLAKKSFDFLPKGGRIILHEMPFNDEKTGPLSTALYNISVIRWTSGRQYSKKELTELLKEAGFIRLECIFTGYLDWALITGVKP